MPNRLTLLEQEHITKALGKTLARFGLEIIRVNYPVETRVLQTTIEIQTLPNLSFLRDKKSELDSKNSG